MHLKVPILSSSRQKEGADDAFALRNQTWLPQQIEAIRNGPSLHITCVSSHERSPVETRETRSATRNAVAATGKGRLTTSRQSHAARRATTFGHAARPPRPAELGKTSTAFERPHTADDRHGLPLSNTLASIATLFHGQTCATRPESASNRRGNG